ncbi:Hint domain-containing protein [Sphingomonas solaris]|uniref:Hint domain-containing protein n=1 Tax=Alterirhizorhabdus solaris TaxID=2529389 RepID=A0A558R1L8_9SPHN|nr:Hint domain-containing protein [Sphingomonas solaris]TVV73286.1 Hint domain-containing protein [Sphingomonas solaris]
MAVTFNNTMFNSGQSTTGLLLGSTFGGTNLLSGTTPVTINGTIGVPGSSTVDLQLNLLTVGAVNLTGTYAGFSDAGGGDYVYYFNATLPGIITTPITVGVTGAASLPTIARVTVNTTAVTAPVGPAIPCYAAGTLILTPRGEIAVEELAIGDEVVTASGRNRPITWLGHRTIDCTVYPQHAPTRPILIRANAVAPGMPRRDLRVSPDHALFFDDVLVQARFLVNGTTIVRDDVTSVTYWHVELASHDVLVAENMPSESYLDVGNRRSFLEAGTVVSLRPEFATDGGEGHCAPLVIEGERLHAIRAWLADRARHLGARHDADSALALVADGIVLAPVEADAGRLTYRVPAGTQTLRLASRTAVPAEVDVTATDTRPLGVCVTAIELDGAAIALDDPRLTAGWHQAEGGWRWTAGDAALPVSRTLMIAATGYGAYPVQAPKAADTMPYRMVG